MAAQKKSIDKATQQLSEKARKDGVSTAWDRLETQTPQCSFGEIGICCRNCFMGPCRIDPFGEKADKGVCGADADTIAARNFTRMIAGGASAHSDHGRDAALTLLETAQGKAQGYQIKDEEKLRATAELFGINTQGLAKEKIAQELAEKALAEFGKKEGELTFIKRAPEKTQKRWRAHGVVPRSIDREIVEVMHRTHMGVDQEYKNILSQGTRAALGDGWGGSMIATELQDILFGTPKPIRSKINLGVLKEDQVNVIVHGHEPILSEMIVLAASDKELLKLTQEKGAKGINLAGMCCTANEILMRHGIPVAGNFLQQEMAIVTGAVDAMVVDVQCV
ncbi:MAG: carbon monoxide dehydrogenase, partial [Candidatus Omnitrophota bacterium]